MNSAEAMKASVDYLEPLLDDESAGKTNGVVVIATVKGDIHDIGKNLVAIMLKNYGFTVYDLGKMFLPKILLMQLKSMTQIL